MADIRVEKLAKLLVDYSLKIKKGDYFVIEASDMAYPLIKEVYRLATRKGANIDVNVTLPELYAIFYREASDEQLEFVKPSYRFLSENYDVMLSIWGEHNEKELSNTDSSKIKKAKTASKDVYIKLLGRMPDELRWCGTQFPTQASAQEAGMSYEEYEDFVYGAGLMNYDDPVSEWRKISKKQQKWCDFLNTKQTLHIKSEETDLKMKIKGRKWINCDGQMNFPDGEIFTTPLEETVEGCIKFSFPGIYMGKEIEDIRLEFSNGKVVKASAAKGEDLLLALLDTDEGARYVGEIAIGTNYGIKKFTKNMLFDEKIGGTVHAAIGSAPKETGGKNQSGIHWDMLCDMKEHGEIYADNELFYKKGQFIKEL